MSYSRARKFWVGLGGLLLVAIIAGAALSWWGWRQWTGPGPDLQEAVVVNIPSGMTLSAAADTLVARGVLRDRRVLLAGAKLTGQDRGLRAGLYQLPPGASPRELLDDLTSGLSVQVKVTIPEGLDAREIADIVAREMGFDAGRFLAIADSLVRVEGEKGHLDPTEGWTESQAQALREAAAIGGRDFFWCEGYLAPDTYLFGAGSEAHVVAGHLVQTQMDRMEKLEELASQGNDQIHTPHQLVTLASIVEAEARHDEERTQIAAVYTNRLRQGWRLEADPTVAFVLNKKGKRLFYKDLEVDSPFNTYRRRGLPPGPIGAPGWKALEATARPDSSCQAMYFVSDGKGGHVFSRTIREHNAAVQRFRQIKAAERRKGRD